MKRKNLFRNFLVAASIGFILQIATPAHAAFGDADPSFGSFGIVNDLYEPSAMARQADGKIVVVGRRYDSVSGWELMVRRYLANGSVDTSFGSNGRAVSYHIGGWAKDVAIQTDGKIAVVGIAPPIDSDPKITAVWRFTADGWYDTSFGSNGRVFGWGRGDCDIAAFRPSRFSTANDLIVLCAGSGEMFRLQSNGSVDTSFGESGGLVVVGYCLVMRYRAGFIYVTGSKSIRKYSSNGLPDPTFGIGGWFTEPPDYFCLGTAVSADYRSIAFKNDGTIIIAGSVTTNYGLVYTPHLSAHLSDGSYDPSFSGLPCPGPPVFPAGVYPNVQVDSLNRIVTAASANIERRHANGTFDDAYTLSHQFIVDVEVLPDNRILTLGKKYDNGTARTRLTQRLP